MALSGLVRLLAFETQIIERYKHRETSVEESLVEMYLASVSVRRVEDITEALWSTRVSPSTVSELNQKIYKQIDAAAALRSLGWCRLASIQKAFARLSASVKGFRKTKKAGAKCAQLLTDTTLSPAEPKLQN